MSEMKKCIVPNCDLKHDAKGYCKKHYSQHKRIYLKNNNLSQEEILSLIIEKKEAGKTPKSCSVEGCQRKYHCKGYCSMHYRRFLRTGKINEVKSCSVERCQEKYHCKGYCYLHYRRMLYSSRERKLKINKCILDTCDNAMYKKNLCIEHYNQKYNK